MIKRILISLVLALVFNTMVFSQSVKTKTFKRNSFVLKVEHYDQYGNIYKETECFNEDCSTFKEHVYVFNEKNQLIEDSLYTNKYGYYQLILKYKYSYNRHGLLWKKASIEKDCPTGYKGLDTYYYNHQHELIRLTKQNVCDSLESKYSLIYFKYDSIGNKIAKIAMNHHDSTLVWYKNVYEYDQSNNLISDTYYYREYNDSLRFSQRDVYEYDKDNRLIQKKWMMSKSNADSTGYTYYENGSLKTEIFYPKYSDDYFQWFEFEYDEKGLEIKKQLYYIPQKRKKKGWAQKIEYEFY